MTSPIAVTFLIAVAGLVLARFGRRRLGLWLMGGAVAWLWLWMTPAMTRVVGVPLESEFLVNGMVPSVESLPEADAIVLLGGGMGIETNLSNYPEMWAGADRVWQAARLWKAGKAPRIFATSRWVEDTTFPLLKDFGVPADCLSGVDDARNTEEEAKSIASLGVKKLLLVTSAWHMKRARMMFEKYAPEVQVVCAPSDFENSFKTVVSLSLRDLLPDTYSFHLNSAAFHEWIGILGYKMFR